MASLWCHTAHKVGGAFRYPGGHREVGDGAAGAQRMAALRLRFGDRFSYALAQLRFLASRDHPFWLIVITRSG